MSGSSQPWTLDWYTNVFYVAEINSLKWACLTAQPSSSNIEEDIVLNAYADCIKSSLLCTWRRRQYPTTNPESSLTKLVSNFQMAKELWLFWNSQDEPKCLPLLKTNGLFVPDDSQYTDQVVDYEVRVLFFKALHGFLERRFYQEGYLRFGKWFSKPLTTPLIERTNFPKYVNAINFEFFLHRDSYVCMIVKIQRQPSIAALKISHFSTKTPQPVILAPWSLKASLLPNQPLVKGQGASEHANSEFEKSAEKEWDKWIKFLIPAGLVSDDKELPKMVLVKLPNGVPMFYPTRFVGIVIDELANQKPSCADCYDQDENINPNGCDAHRTKSRDQNKRPSDQFSLLRQKGLMHSKHSVEQACLSKMSLSSTSSKFMEPNFDQYYRARRCECNICTSSKYSNLRAGTSAPEYDMMQNVFHHSTSNLESLTPEHSPTILTKLESLKDFHKSVKRDCNSTNDDPFALSNPNAPFMTKNKQRIPNSTANWISKHSNHPARTVGSVDNQTSCTSKKLNDPNNSGGNKHVKFMDTSVEHTTNPGPSTNIHELSQKPTSESQQRVSLLKSLLDNTSENSTSSVDLMLSSCRPKQLPILSPKNKRISRFTKNKKIKTTKLPILQDFESEFKTLEWESTSCPSLSYPCSDYCDGLDYDDSMQTDENMTAITPPALLDGLTDTEFAPGTSLADNILSPPASNEWIDSTMGHLNNGTNVLNPTTMLGMDSLSHMYPTPPTPAMFQLSPQMCTNSFKEPLKMSQHALIMERLTQPPILVKKKRIYNSTIRCRIPRSSSFGGKLLNNRLSLCRRLRSCKNCKTTGILKVSLKNRRKNRKKCRLRKPQKYREDGGAGTRPSRSHAQKIGYQFSGYSTLKSRTPDAPILPTNRNNSDISAPESLRGLLEKGAAHDFAPNQTFQDLVNKEFRPIESGPSIPFSSNYGPSLPLTTALPYHHIDPSTVPVDHLSNSLTNPADLDHTLKTDGHNDCGNCGDWEIDNPEKAFCSATINLFMQDTIANYHFDPVFDACPICSCNSNIRGSELGIYVTAPKDIVVKCDKIQHKQNMDPLFPLHNFSGFKISSELQRCKCGFSVVRHRYLSGPKSGLFTDDILESNGSYLSELIDNCDQRTSSPFLSLLAHKLSQQSEFINLIRQQSLNCYDHFNNHLSSRLDTAKLNLSEKYVTSSVDTVELNGIISLIMLPHLPNADIEELIHHWGYQVASGVNEPRDVEYLIYFDLLKEMLKNTVGTITNYRLPEQTQMSIRSFFRKNPNLKVSTQDDEKNARIEPIPNLIVGTHGEKELVLLAPQSIHQWDKLEMAPFDQQKNILYLALVPDIELVIEKTRIYLDELSSVYDKKCKFGSHSKIQLRNTPQDGFLRVNFEPNGTYFTSQNSENLKSLMSLFDGISADQAQCNQIRMYVRNCYGGLFNFFTSFKSTIFEPRAFHESISRQRHQTSVVPLPDSSAMPPPFLNSATDSTAGQSFRSSFSNISEERPSRMHQVDSASSEIEIEKEVDDLLASQISLLPHIIVLYMVNPFGFGGQNDDEISRLALIAFMQVYNTILRSIPIDKRPQLQLELLDLQTIYDYTGFFPEISAKLERNPRERLSAYALLRKMAFDVYTNARLVIPECIRGSLAKNMTRFGPTASLTDLLDALPLDLKQRAFKHNCLPFILASNKVATLSATGANTSSDIKCPLLGNRDDRILLVSYCLIKNEWLCIGTADECGILIDNALINIKTPSSRVKQKPKNRHSQIFDSILRLWHYIQGTMAMGNKNWRLIISRLGKIGHGEFKAWTEILTKPNLRMYNENLKSASNEMFCKPCSQMHGYYDMPVILSASLISIEMESYLRVFPSLSSLEMVHQNSSKTQKGASKSSQTTQFPPDDTSTTHIMVFPTILNVSGHQNEDQKDADDIDDYIFNNNGDDNWLNDNALNEIGFLVDDFGDAKNDEDNNINNQPMATGYSISTAPLYYNMPESFWSSCPNLKLRTPVNLKSSLHIHCSNIQQTDEYSISSKSDTHHPLDSTATDEVLRFIMETHNTLSWLNIDFSTGNRRSCLPINIQALLRLYNTINELLLK